MKSIKTFLVLVTIITAWRLNGFDAMGQSYVEYKFVFTGTAYETNAAGNIVGTPITDQTLLQSQAERLNITNLSTISIVYHIDGGLPYGDTVDVVSNATGETLTSEFGFYFGSDTSLGRYLFRNAVAFAVTTVLAALSYRFLETPFLTLKQRFSRVPSRPGA